MDMQLRDMAAADLFKVADLERRLFSDPWSIDSFRGALRSQNQVFLVCDDDGTIAGYCGMLMVPGEGQILNVAVDENYRRRGLATEMMNAMIDIGTTNEIFLYTLEVRENNAPALALYKSVGFVPTGRRKGYYKNPEEDAILMDLDLTDPNTLKRFGIED
ncbi:MAG: ribosomal protein S18-alanine N-acetyltransferase [Lachnospiraceae bacterium]|nr:ribosomal protein S18-alanine N-acetyltransferase [Lachnospiraceae bacterium]MBR5732555.1 ribosomal protein S18-alanine N-acetyltransferase [Lachnospiraceae bacterium]